MGHTIDAKTITNRQVLEGLWAMGIDPNVLNGVDSNKSPLDFILQLHNAGITDEQRTQARNLVAWRPDAGNVNDFIKTLQMEGVQPEQIKQIVRDAQQRSAQPGIRGPGQQLDFMGLPGLSDLGAVKLDLGDLTAAASAALSPQQVTQARIKTGQTQGITQDQWNPFRDDRNTAAPAPAPAPAAAQGPQFDDSLIQGKAQTKTGATKPISTAPKPAAAAPPTQTPEQAAAAKAAADQAARDKAANPANWDDEHVRTWLKQNLGSDSWFIDIPDVWTAMKDAVKGGKGVTGADAAFKATAFYQQSSSSARLWYQKEREDPASAASDIAKQTQAITKIALDSGITLDPDRAQQMAQSYLRYGWSNADLQQAIAAEWHYDPSTKNQAAAVTQMKTQAQNWLVPLSDQAIQTWGQGLIAGTVTQDQYTQYLRDNAKSLMPQLSSLIDQHAGDPNFSVSTFADPYKQHAANLLGIQPDQINLADSKWRQALDTVDPKTGERRIMTLGEWESKIKTDKNFGYDNTANGIKDGLQLADALKTSMGY